MREQLHKYFTLPAGTRIVPLSQIVPVKQQPKSIGVALSRMEMAARGDGDKRGPITLQRISPRKYVILDGNATYGAALELGWRYIAAEIVPWRGQRATIHVMDKLTRKSYPGVYQDSNLDGIPDVDDPAPSQVPGVGDSVETIRFSSVMDRLLQRRAGWEGTRKRIVAQARGLLRQYGLKGTVTSRSKTPYSVINKLVNKRMSNPLSLRKRLPGTDPRLADYRGLTDVVGIMIATKGDASMSVVSRLIDQGALGPVLEKEDTLTAPKCGYRSIHYLVERDGIPVEVQLKTRTLARAQEITHEVYKLHQADLDCDQIALFFLLAWDASKEDPEAARQFRALLRDPRALVNSLLLSRGQRGRHHSRGHRATLDRYFGSGYIR